MISIWKTAAGARARLAANLPKVTIRWLADTSHFLMSQTGEIDAFLTKELRP
jgi:hypothetical protein